MFWQVCYREGRRQPVSYVRKFADDERIELERVIRDEVGRVSQRAQMVLLSDQGYTCPEIGRVLHVSTGRVRYWLRGFNARGVEGLYREPWGSRARKIARQNATPEDGTSPCPPVLSDGVLEISYVRERVTLKGKLVRLTPTEYTLLCVMSANAGKPLKPSALLRLVWGREGRNQLNSLRVYIRRLRKKLESDPMHPRYILTEPRAGYLFDVNPRVGPQ